MEEHKLELKRRYKVSAERLFEVWTKAEMLKEWFCPESMTVPEAEVDLKVGGKFKITMRSKDGNDYTATGEYIEIDKPNKIVMSWKWENDMFKDESTILSAKFKEMGEETELKLTHTKLSSEKSVESHTDGWVSAMDHLGKFLG